MALTKIDDRGLKTPIDLIDNEKIRFGTGNDLEIYHDPAYGHSFIKESGSGALIVGASTFEVYNAAISEKLISATEDGAVELYHNGVKKVETTSYGLRLTDNYVEATQSSTSTPVLRLGDTGVANYDFTFPDNNTIKLSTDTSNAQQLELQNAGSGSFGLSIADNGKALFGDGDDIEIFHDGSHSWIKNSTGNLYINGKGGEVHIAMVPDAGVELRYNDVKKFETITSGVRLAGDLELLDNTGSTNRLLLGNGGDLQMYHDGTHSYLKEAGTGNFYVMASSKLQIDNTAGDKTMAAFHDGGAVELYHNNVKKIETGQQYNYVYAVASGNPAGLAVRNINDASDYSHAELRLESKNNAVYSSLYTDKANASLRLGYNTTGATFNVFNDGTVRSAGIKFGSDTAAANALNDYEEGTWTPNPLFGTTDAGETVDANGGNAGSYTKIGNLVYCQFTVNFSNRSGSASGSFKVDGLPFAISANNWNEDGGTVHYFSGISSAGDNVCLMCENTNRLAFFQDGNDQWSTNEVGTGAIRIRGSITYHTAA